MILKSSTNPMSHSWVLGDLCYGQYTSVMGVYSITTSFLF